MKDRYCTNHIAQGSTNFSITTNNDAFLCLYKRIPASLTLDSDSLLLLLLGISGKTLYGDKLRFSEAANWSCLDFLSSASVFSITGGAIGVGTTTGKSKQNQISCTPSTKQHYFGHVVAHFRK